MIALWAVVLLGCGQVREGGGSAVGNPGQLTSRLAPQGELPWTSVQAGTTELVLTPCRGAPFVATASGVDLSTEPGLTVPGLDYCRLEVTVTDLAADGVRGPLEVDRATASLELDGLRFDDAEWIVELGEPERPEALADRSGLYLELMADGTLDALERSFGAVIAGPEREPEPEPVVLMAVGVAGLRAPLAGKSGPSYAQTDGGESFVDAAFDAGRWVAVGGDTAGRTAVSDDQGLAWSVADWPTPLTAVASRQGTFYAVGTASDVLASDDGLDWDVRSTENSVWRDVIDGPAGLVIVGSDAVLTSPDGFDFVREDLGTGLQLYGVASGPPGLVAVGEDGGRWFSADGTGWVQTDLGGEKLVAVAWSGTRFVAAGLQQTWTSPDGISWSPGPDQSLGSLVVHDGVLLGARDDEVLLSIDEGNTWSTWRTVDAGSQVHGLGTTAP